MKKYFILILVILVGITGCRKDRIYTNVDTEKNDPSIRINSSVFGMLVDGNGDTKGATEVYIKDKNALTDEDGFFIFKDIFMNEKGTTIKAEVPGYFVSYKVITPQHNHTSSVLLSLLEKRMEESFDSQNEKLLTDISGATAKTPKNGLLNSSLQKYNGSVKGSMRWVDPNSNEYIEVMPGHFVGQNTQGLNKILKTFGMLVVELRDDNGQMLFLDQNESVELQFPVPQNLLSNAPANIPLWFFDEHKSLWVEDGIAQLENGYYIGNVNQLGYWTCNASGEMSSIEAKIKFENNSVASNYMVQIISPNNSANENLLLTYSDDEGLLTGNIPAEEILELKIISSCDDQIFYQAEIGPFPEGEKVVMSEIIIPDEMVDNYTLSGVLYDCDLKPIKNGYVKTVNQLFPSSSITNIDGTFELSGVACTQNEIVFKIFDLDDYQNGEIRRLPFSEYLQTGNIVLCDRVKIEKMEIDYLGENYTCNSYLSLSGKDPSTLDRTGEVESEFECIMSVYNYKGVGDYNINDSNVDLRLRLLKKVNGKRRYIEFDDSGNTKINIISDDGLWVRGAINGMATRKTEVDNTVIDSGIMSIFFEFPRYIE